MKIVHVIDQLSLTHGGGAAMVVFHLAEAQAKLGHDVTIITTNWQAEGQAEPLAVHLVTRRPTFTPLGIRFAPTMVFDRVDKDVVLHIHQTRGIPEAIFAIGSPNRFVFQAHGSLPFKPRGFLGGLMERPWLNLLRRKVGVCVAESEMEGKQYIAAGFDPSTVVLIPPGINFAEFATLPVRQQCGRSILYLGRLNSIKGIDLLIEAFAKLDPRLHADLVIAGPDDGDDARLRRLAADVRGVTFVGGLYGRQKIQAYVDAKLYVLPSRYEIFGVTVLEALACGTPVLVTSACGAIPALAGAVAVASNGNLAQALESELEHPSSSFNYRRAIARQFDWSNIAHKHIEAYQKLKGGCSDLRNKGPNFSVKVFSVKTGN